MHTLFESNLERNRKEMPRLPRQDRCEPIYTAKFSDSSCGYRPGTNAKQAIERIEAIRDEGPERIVDADMTAFVDTANHEKLMDAVAERISDDRVQRLIKSFLKTDMMAQGPGRAENIVDTPQGGHVASRLADCYRRDEARGSR